METLLTVREAAQQLGKTEKGLRWMIHVGNAPRSGKVGGRRMFRQSDIDSYLEAAFAD